MKTLYVLISIVVVFATGCSTADLGEFNAQSSTFDKCADYPSQPQAQAAWEDAGRPEASSRDKDGDGVVCTSLPKKESASSDVDAKDSSQDESSAQTTDCTRTDQVVEVELDEKEYPNILRHVDESVENGYPRVWVVNRDGADKRRDKLLSGIPTKPGHDRDESPASVGRSKVDASVMYVPSSENRSAGSIMGQALREYCDGQKFQLIGE